MRTTLWTTLRLTVATALVGAWAAAAAAEREGNRPALEAPWSDLEGDAAKAYRAIWTFRRTPREAVTFLTSHQPPAVSPDPKSVTQWISDLNSERFGVRERANRELEKLGELAEPALQNAAKSNLPLEVRQRVEKLLAKLESPLTLPELLREVRAVEALEHIGSPEAQALLRKYAAGAPAARLTREAREALARLGRYATHGPPAPPPEARSHTDLYGDPLPPGALVRLGTVRFRRHGDFGLYGFNFLPDGKTLLTAQGHLVQLWEVPGGRLLRELATDPLSIQGFALAPDGKQFAVAGTHPMIGPHMPGAAEVRVFDLASGKPVRSFFRKDHQDVYHSHLTFSGDGKRLFSIGYSGRLRVEEVATGKELLQKKFRSDYPTGIAISPDSAYLAIGPGPNTRKLYLWKWQQEEPQEIPVGDRRVQAVRFSPDGQMLAVVFDGADLQVWQVPGRRSLYQWHSPEERYRLSGALAFTPDGKSLLVSLYDRRRESDGKLLLLEPRTGQTQEALPIASSRLTISPNGHLLAVSYDNGVRLWDLATRTEVAPNDAAHWSEPSHVLVSPKGFLATTALDNSVRLWDAATGKQQRKFQLHQWVRDIALSPDSRLLAASSFDDAVHVWDVAGGREIYRVAGHGELGGRRTLGFLPDSRGLLSWGDDFYLRHWDMKTGKALLEHDIRPSGVKLPDREDPDPVQKELRMELAFGSSVFTPDGKTFLLNMAGNYYGFDSRTGNERFKFPAGQSGMLSSLALSPDSKYLLVSAWGSNRVEEHTVRVLDPFSGKQLRQITLPGSRAGAVAFSADGRSFAATLEPPQGKILVYEMASGEVRCTIGGLRSAVRSLGFFPDLRRLASGLDDSTVLLWDLEERARLAP